MPLKVSHLYRFSRGWLAVAAIVLGVLSGYFVGRFFILHIATTRLKGFTERVLQRDEELAQEVSDTLTLANNAGLAPCSEEDNALLRRLTFASRFLKDVGRLENGQIVCSAALGKFGHPALPRPHPDVVLPSGAAIYSGYPLVVMGGESAEFILFRNANVVVGRDVFSDFPRAPIAFAAGVPDIMQAKFQSAKQATLRQTSLQGGVEPGSLNLARARSVVLSGTTGKASIPAGVLESKETVQIAGSLYYAQCSLTYPVCAAANIPMAAVWHTNRALMGGYLATGGAAGLTCASALLVAGRKRRSHTNQLKRAILMGKLSVVYQPIVELDSHRIVGAEALARWTDEEGESIRPETIIALAEEEGFVSEITRFVLTRALSEVAPIFDWHPQFQLSFNLAPSDLADPRLLLLLDESLHGSRIKPENIAFELPERATSSREVAVAAIRRLRKRGHAVFIDEFGTGYSNLAYLTELDVDGIKINRSFIATFGTDSVTASIVPQILEVARALSLKVVVQGVEREQQARYFTTGDQRMLGQGWYFGLPVPAKALMYLCAEKFE